MTTTPGDDDQPLDLGDPKVLRELADDLDDFPDGTTGDAAPDDDAKDAACS